MYPRWTHWRDLKAELAIRISKLIFNEIVDSENGHQSRCPFSYRSNERNGMRIMGNLYTDNLIGTVIGLSVADDWEGARRE